MGFNYEPLNYIDRKVTLAVLLVGDEPASSIYVKAKENCGKIKFYDPLDQRLIKAPRKSVQNDLNIEAVTFTPQEGDLLIFPSYFHHSVEENLSGEDRIVISFNVEIQKIS